MGSCLEHESFDRNHIYGIVPTSKPPSEVDTMQYKTHRHVRQLPSYLMPNFNFQDTVKESVNEDEEEDGEKKKDKKEEEKADKADGEDKPKPRGKGNKGGGGGGGKSNPKGEKPEGGEKEGGHEEVKRTKPMYEMEQQAVPKALPLAAVPAIVVQQHDDGHHRGSKVQKTKRQKNGSFTDLTNPHHFALNKEMIDHERLVENGTVLARHGNTGKKHHHRHDPLESSVPVEFLEHHESVAGNHLSHGELKSARKNMKEMHRITSKRCIRGSPDCSDDEHDANHMRNFEEAGARVGAAARNADYDLVNGPVRKKSKSKSSKMKSKGMKVIPDQHYSEDETTTDEHEVDQIDSDDDFLGRPPVSVGLLGAGIEGCHRWRNSQDSLDRLEVSVKRPSTAGSSRYDVCDNRKSQEDFLESSQRTFYYNNRPTDQEPTSDNNFRVSALHQEMHGNVTGMYLSNSLRPDEEELLLRDEEELEREREEEERIRMELDENRIYGRGGLGTLATHAMHGDYDEEGSSDPSRHDHDDESDDEEVEEDEDESDHDDDEEDDSNDESNNDDYVPVEASDTEAGDWSGSGSGSGDNDDDDEHEEDGNLDDYDGQSVASGTSAGSGGTSVVSDDPPPDESESESEENKEESSSSSSSSSSEELDPERFRHA